MIRRKPEPLPPPTMEEREQARQAALAMRAALKDPSKAGRSSRIFLTLSNPRRGVRVDTWENLPGLSRSSGPPVSYQHRLLPGWQYSRDEVRTEMIPDLEALAEHGVRPTEATSPPSTNPTPAKGSLL